MTGSGWALLGYAVDDFLAVNLGSENCHASVAGDPTGAFLVEPGGFHCGEDLEGAIWTDVTD